MNIKLTDQIGFQFALCEDCLEFQLKHETLGGLGLEMSGQTRSPCVECGTFRVAVYNTHGIFGVGESHSRQWALRLAITRAREYACDEVAPVEDLTEITRMGLSDPEDKSETGYDHSPLAARLCSQDVTDYHNYLAPVATPGAPEDTDWWWNNGTTIELTAEGKVELIQAGCKLCKDAGEEWTMATHWTSPLHKGFRDTKADPIRVCKDCAQMVETFPVMDSPRRTK